MDVRQFCRSVFDVRIIGKTIGKFRVDQRLGSGGYGAVYLAENPKIRDKVAIKFLFSDSQLTDEALARFLHEALAPNSAEHPALVKVRDHGLGADIGLADVVVAYLVMEYAAGKTLSDVISDEGKMDPERVVRLGRFISTALHAVHEQGIVHRDLKPDNLILAKDPDVEGRERIRVLDFGIAKLRETTVGTNTGLMMGTAQYTSPEQWRSAKDVDRRTDVYSLGCVLYQMLAGVPPFEGTQQEVMFGHLTQTPRPLGEHEAEVPEYLQTVVAKALEKEPAQRFQSMQELAEALGEPERAHSLAGESPVDWNPSAAFATTEAPQGSPLAVAAHYDEMVVAGITITSSLIPTGTFLMGAPVGGEGWYEDERQHQVTLTRPYFMMVHPATQALWEAVTGYNPSGVQDDRRPVNQVSWFEVMAMANTLSEAAGLDKAYDLYKEQGEPGDHQYRIEEVRWKGFDNQGWRLPTEAEWEYACRAGGTEPRYGNLDEVAWYKGNSDGQAAHPVGQKNSNAWGLSDMLGNVWEWCWDRYDMYEEGPATDPKGSVTGVCRAARGGSWDDEAKYIWAPVRYYWTPDMKQHRALGVRFVRTAPPEQSG